MDLQHHSKPTTPTGHEVHICHRCGWPFPNAHPSSKHRRAHKRICGTIEGYTKLIDSKAVSDDEHHSDDDDDDIEKTPSPMIEKRIVKESGSSAGRMEERSNRSEEDLFSDAVTDFSDSGISPDIKNMDEKLEMFVTPDSHAKNTETDVNTISKLSDSDMNASVHLVEDEIITVKSISESSKVIDDKFEMHDSKDQGEDVFVLSVSNDVPQVDHAESLLQDFKDHKTIHSSVPMILDPVGDKDAQNESMIDDDTFEIKTVEESQTSENVKSMESAVIIEEAPEVVDSVPVSAEEDVVLEAEKKMVESVGAAVNDSGKVGISYISEKVAVDKGEQSSGVVTEALVDEGNGKLLTSQDCGVAASIGSSSRNSLEGNWGSVSVLSTASYDVENAHSIGKPEIAVDKTHLGKSDAVEGPPLVTLKEETVDQKASEIKTLTVQNSQPPKPEVKVSNETEGRKRNEEAIAKVTNWSTGEHTNAPIKNLVNEANAFNPKQLAALIQKDEAAENTSEVKKSNLTLETPKVNQESSPPKYINEGKKDRKKTKGIASWIPFVCCSSVNVN